MPSRKGAASVSPPPPAAIAYSSSTVTHGWSGVLPMLATPRLLSGTDEHVKALMHTGVADSVFGPGALRTSSEAVGRSRFTDAARRVYVSPEVRLGEARNGLAARAKFQPLQRRVHQLFRAKSAKQHGNGGAHDTRAPPPAGV